MNKILKHTELVALSGALLLLGGCAACRIGNGSVTLNDKKLTLTPDSLSMVDVDAEFNVPAKYLTKRGRLFITPQLYSDGELVEEFSPLVLDGSIYAKKQHRREVLDGVEDKYDATTIKCSQQTIVPFKERIKVDGVTNGEIMATIAVDGCATCNEFDAVAVADIAEPITLMPDIKEALHVNYMEPMYVSTPKIRTEKGEAKLYFDINLYNINLAKANNAVEMNTMLGKLKPIVNDSLVVLNSATIIGIASADGSLPFNTTLSYNRAQSAKNWLFSKLNLTAEQKAQFKVESEPAGWEPVIESMRKANDADTTVIMDIMRQHPSDNDDVQEPYIRRSRIWNRLKTLYLESDRIVRYTYGYTIKSFTSDEELMAMYTKRPDAFNEYEMLRVAVLSDTTKQADVYRDVLHYFPASEVASNNLALLLLQGGDEESARYVLKSRESLTDKQLNTLAATYVYDNDFERAIELLHNVDIPEARYNLGLIKAKQRKFREAYDLLKPFGDTNSAIVALSLGLNYEAEEIMSAYEGEEPLDSYVRAVVAARLLKRDVMLKELEKGVQNATLKERAVRDNEFNRYSSNPQFMDIVK